MTYDGVIIKPSLDDVLEHHGVKGMKWGIRKRRVAPGVLKRRSKADYAVEGKKYNDYYNKAIKQKEKANSLWKDADSKYKKLGKTRLTRMIRAARGKTAEAKAYSKAYDKASSADDRANEALRKSKKQYKKLGKTRITRIVRAAKYAK